METVEDFRTRGWWSRSKALVLVTAAAFLAGVLYRLSLGNKELFPLILCFSFGLALYSGRRGARESSFLSSWWLYGLANLALLAFPLATTRSRYLDRYGYCIAASVVLGTLVVAIARWVRRRGLSGRTELRADIDPLQDPTMGPANQPGPKGATAWEPKSLPSAVADIPIGQAVTPGRATGIAGNIHWRQVEHGEVLAFVLDRWDPNGNALDPLPVELRGHRLTGVLTDGDQVIVQGRWKAGLLVAKEIRNVSHGGAMVRQTGQSPAARALLTAVIVGILIALLAVALDRWT